MAGFGNALLSGAQARYFVDRNNAARALETGRQEALPDVPAALAGDPDAIGRVAQKSPDMLSRISPILARLDAHKQGQVKAAADFTAGASNAILNAPQAERGVLYKHYLGEAQRLGHDVSKMSPDYTPETESRLKFARDQAIPIQTWFTQQRMDARKAVKGGGGRPAHALEPLGGAPAGPVRVSDASPVDGVMVSEAPKPEHWRRIEGGVPPQRITDALTRRPTLDESPMPDAQMAQADVPPIVEQGGGDIQMAQASGDGTPLPPADGGRPSRGTISPVDPTQHGYKLAQDRKKPGVPVEQNGYFVYINPADPTDTVLHKPAGPPKPAERPLPPIGYQFSPAGGLAPIPGGPADTATITRNTEARRRADEKAVPMAVSKQIQTNLDALRQLDRAEGELDRVPGSVGGVGSVLAANIPGVGNLQNRNLMGMGDPEGAKIRALVANIGSLMIHERSGAAVTAAEFPRLKPFVPQISDDPATVKKKLQTFREVYADVVRDLTEYYGPNNGFRDYEPATRYLNEKSAPSNPPAGAALGNAEKAKLLFDARRAIKEGAPEGAVLKRLKEMGAEGGL